MNRSLLPSFTALGHSAARSSVSSSRAVGRSPTKTFSTRTRLSQQPNTTHPRAFSNSTHSHSLCTSSQDDSTRPLLVLGLESSADDTCAAVLHSASPSQRPSILSNVVLKQATIHEQYGGIHPLHAQEAHHRNMPLAISQALQTAGVGLADLDAVAFTRGPGMWGGLAVSMGAAKTLVAVRPELKLVGVHHMQAHALTPFLTEEVKPEFPFLTLLVSGGHTLLLLARAEDKFEILATAQDESIGMAFDKVCRDLAIPWSEGAGAPGAALSSWADLPTSPVTTPKGQHSAMFTLPFRGKLAFSFSGLRSALTRILAAEPVSDMTEARSRQLAREFVTASVAQVEEKVKLAVRECDELLGRDAGSEGTRLKAVVASGGVASNAYLRMRLRHTLDTIGLKDLPLVFPPPALCTDNAAMIANVGIDRIRRGRWDGMEVMPIAKWPITHCEAEFEVDKETQ